MAPLISTMPALPLDAECTIEWVALDPTTGADVTGVMITNPTLYGIDLTGNVGVTHVVPFDVPLLVPLPAADLAGGGSQ